MRVIQTLQRGLSVLDLLIENSEPLRTSEVAERFAIDKANASRLLATLHEAGWVRRTEDRRFAIGSKLSSGAWPLERLLALRDSTHSLLEGLVEASGECAHMAVLVGDKVWYVDKVASPQVLRVDHPVGALAPLHCTALGKVFLASGMRAVPETLERFTERTLTKRVALERDLEEARERGFASDDEEFSPGVRCVAAALRRDDGTPTAAIGLSGPSARVNRRRLMELGRLVRERCQNLVTA